MSLDPSPIEPVPQETARVARAIFPKGNRSLLLRDTLGTLFTDPLFADLFPTRGQPALAPWRLALVTLFQSIEGLPDRQAAEAVRTRMDLKDALGLSLTDPGFDFSVRSRVPCPVGRAQRSRRGCWMCCWKQASGTGGVQQEDASARTPPMCSPGSVG